MSDRSIQKAGANSNQVQAGTVNQYFGMSEKRVEEIVDERCARTLSNCILESRLVAEQRIGDFKTELLGIFARKPDLVHALEEPSCVDSFERAARTATRSSKVVDNKLLSELLERRFEDPRNRHVATGVNRAIEIVDQITDEELNGLTILFAVERYSPNSGLIGEGLAVLDALYGKLPINNLPNGGAWIDSLDIHDALRTSTLGSLKKYSDYFFKRLEGYTVWGVEKDSELFVQAVNWLSDTKIPVDILVDHELHSGYVRLGICNRGRINELVFTGQNDENVSPDAEQIAVLNQLFDQMNVVEHEQEMKAAFEKKLKAFTNIVAVQDWWDNISSAPRITVVGEALANANARRIDPTLPDLEIN